MKNLIDTLIDMATTFAGLAIEHLRELLAVIVGVALLVAAHVMFQHVVAGQAAEQAMFDQLTKPVAHVPAPAATAASQQWCSVNTWPSSCH